MINQNYNAIALLNNISNIEVIDECMTIGELAFLPYCDYKEILELPEGKYLFSHQDIQGSVIRGDFKLPVGIETENLKKYKFVFNGHIHKPSINNNIINIGSITTHSFSDDEDFIPQCYIFYTETIDLKTFNSNLCTLFKKVNINSINDLETYINNLNPLFKYILHIICPFEIRDIIKNILEEYKDLIVNSRINIKIQKENKNDLETPLQENVNLQSNVDISQSFKEFLDITELKYPTELYLDVLQGLE